MEKKEHPHAQVLRWIADGEEIEGRYVPDGDWRACSHKEMLVLVANSREGWQFRIKPTPMCGLVGIKFPVPMREAPKVDDIYWTAGISVVCKWIWCGDDIDFDFLNLGLCHTTEEAAKAHSEALRKANLMAIEGAK